MLSKKTGWADEDDETQGGGDSSSFSDPIFDGSDSPLLSCFSCSRARRTDIAKFRKFPSQEFLNVFEETPVALSYGFLDCLQQTLKPLKTPKPELICNLQGNGKIWKKEEFNIIWEKSTAGSNGKLVVASEGEGGDQGDEPSVTSVLDYLNACYFYVESPKSFKNQSGWYTFLPPTSFYQDNKLSLPHDDVPLAEHISLPNLSANLQGYTVQFFVKWKQAKGRSKSRSKKAAEADDSDEDEVQQRKRGKKKTTHIEEQEAQYKTETLFNWFKNHARKTQISAMTFLPSQPSGFIKFKDLNIYNSWSGLPYYADNSFQELPSADEDGFFLFGDRAASQGKNPAQIQAQREDDYLYAALIWRHISEVLCNGVPQHFNYLLYWLASVIQTPSTQTGVVAMIIGTQGCGKTVFEEFFVSLFGNNAVFLHSHTDFFRQFSGNLFVDKVMLAVDEIAIKTKVEADAFKCIVTGNQLRKEKKGFDPGQQKNYLNILCSTNDQYPVALESNQNRRYFLVDASAKRVHDAEYWGLWFTHIAPNVRARYVFTRILSNMDISKFRIMLVPETFALQRQVIKALNAIQNWWMAKVKAGKHIDPFDLNGKLEHDPKNIKWLMYPVTLVELYEDYKKCNKSLSQCISEPEFLMHLIDLIPFHDKKPSATDQIIRIPSLESCSNYLEKRFPTVFNPWIAVVDNQKYPKVSKKRKAQKSLPPPDRAQKKLTFTYKNYSALSDDDTE